MSRNGVAFRWSCRRHRRNRGSLPTDVAGLLRPSTCRRSAGGGRRLVVNRDVLRCYQQPDDQTMLAVVLDGAELR
jgi:hypothetical protein